MSDAQFRMVKLRALAPSLVDAAVAMFREKFSPATMQRIRNEHVKNPDNWIDRYHFTWGKAVRNLMRDEGFTDARFGGNLDDYYVQLVELAAGCNGKN